MNHTKLSSLTQDPIVGLPWERVKPIELQVGWWGGVVVLLLRSLALPLWGTCALFPQAGASSLEAILIYSLVCHYELH